MKKIIIYILILLLVIITGFIIGILLFKSNKKYYSKYYSSNNFQQNEVNNKTNNNNINKNNIKNSKEIITSSLANKISINTIIIQKTYYNQCGHEIENKIKDTKKYINMTKENFQKEFPNWEIKEFNNNEVILYREEEDFCNEHFLVKNENGYVTIYIIDNEERILDLLEKTNIKTDYLTKVDQDSLEKGIVVYTQINLNKLIEDYE